MTAFASGAEWRGPVRRVSRPRKGKELPALLRRRECHLPAMSDKCTCPGRAHRADQQTSDRRQAPGLRPGLWGMLVDWVGRVGAGGLRGFAGAVGLFQLGAFGGKSGADIK